MPQVERGIPSDFRVSTKVVLLFFCLVLCNILLLGNVVNAAITLVEITMVLYFLIKGRVDHAILWHFMFTLMSIDATNALFGENSAVYDYSGMKLIGPVRISYVISIFLFLISLRNSFKLKGLLYKFLCFLLVIASIGSVFFLYGVFFADYYVDGAVGYFIYVGMTCCNLVVLLKNLTPYLLKALPFYLYNLLIASPVAAFVGWAVFHRVTFYSEVLPSLIQADINYLAPVLIFFAFQKDTKGKIYLYISLSCLLLNLVYAGRGGAILIFAGSCALFLFISFFTSRGKEVPTFVKICILLCVIIGIIQICRVVFDADTPLSLSKIKMQQFLSLFTTFSAKSFEDVRNVMGASPFIRFAELVDSFYENSHNLLHLLFGKGYGSFITDELNLLDGFDLEGGVYSHEQVISGRFCRLHGSFPAAMLIHGLVGIVGFFYFVFAYLRKITISPFAFCAFIWLGMSFYFNYQCAVYGMVSLLICDVAVARHDGLISDSGVFREKKQD